MATLGQRLSYLRQRENMSQEELAEKLKVSKSSVGMYERDQREPSHETLLKLADLFDVSIDYLMGRTDTPSLVTQTKESQKPVFASDLKVADEIFFDGYLEASEEEKELLRRYWFDNIRNKKKIRKDEDVSPSAWELKDK